MSSEKGDPEARADAPERERPEPEPRPAKPADAAEREPASERPTFRVRTTHPGTLDESGGH